MEGHLAQCDNVVYINLCRAVLQDGRVPFHILGLKCPHCLSYNTRRLSIDRDGPPTLRGAQAGQA